MSKELKNLIMYYIDLYCYEFNYNNRVIYNKILKIFVGENYKYLEELKNFVYFNVEKKKSIFRLQNEADDLKIEVNKYLLRTDTTKIHDAISRYLNTYKDGYLTNTFTDNERLMIKEWLFYNEKMEMILNLRLKMYNIKTNQFGYLHQMEVMKRRDRAVLDSYNTIIQRAMGV